MIHTSTFEQRYCTIESTLANVSDRNSFQTNQNYSNSLRYLYLRQCESFRNNWKNVLWLVWRKMVKNRFDLIRLNPRKLLEWIQTNYKPSFRIVQTEFWFRINLNESEIRTIRINSDWKFGLDRCEFGLIRIKNLAYDWFQFIRIVASNWIGLG